MEVNNDMNLVELDEAKRHLRIASDDSSFDAEVNDKIPLASGMVLNRIKVLVEEASPATGPPKPTDVYQTLAENYSKPISFVEANLKAATLAVLAEIYENRLASEAQVFTPYVLALLEPFRDHALA